VKCSETNPWRAAAVVIEGTGRGSSSNVHEKGGESGESRRCTKVVDVVGVDVAAEALL
jgi:hypothetical protein